MRTRSTPVHESTTRRALAKRHSGRRSTVGERMRRASDGVVSVWPERVGLGRRTVALVGGVQALDVPRKHPAVHAPGLLRDLYGIKRRSSHRSCAPCGTVLTAGLHRVRLITSFYTRKSSVSHTIVSRTPGSGFIPNIRRTDTCVWPPPMSTTSFSTGDVCIFLASLKRNRFHGRAQQLRSPVHHRIRCVEGRGACTATNCRSRRGPDGKRGGHAASTRRRETRDARHRGTEAHSAAMADAARVASSAQATTASAPKERLDNQVLHLLYVREARRHVYSSCRLAAARFCILSFLLRH